MTLVEGIARLLFERLAADPDWDDAYETREQAKACGDDDYSQEECLEIAREVVKAIPKVPTIEMYEAISNCGLMWVENNSANVWRLMLAAALGEKVG